MFLESSTGLDLWVYFVIGGAVLVIALVVVLLLLLKKKKPKQKHIKVDEPFITNLLELLGGKDNIKECQVDNGRLKFNVINLDTVNLNGIKEVATSGVFVTGNIIKTLFKLDSKIIKTEIDRVIKGWFSMIKKSFRITSETGIHARPATQLVNVAMKYNCDITLTALKRTVDFKSIMGVMALGIYSGTTIEIKCDGKDEEAAMDDVTDTIIKSGLGKEL